MRDSCILMHTNSLRLANAPEIRISRDSGWDFTEIGIKGFMQGSAAAAIVANRASAVTTIRSSGACSIYFRSENGIIGFDERPSEPTEDEHLADAGGIYV